MQQAIYNTTHNSIKATHNSIKATQKTILTMTTTAPAARPMGLARRMAGRWDMVGVLALMGSSAAYGVFALAHLGL